MSGYREHSFDPNAYEQPGPPLKPYNKVEWTGVAIGTVGVLLAVLHLAIRSGLLSFDFDVGAVPVAFTFLGLALIYSRRAPRNEDSQGAN